ncbi:ribonuclease H-like domain-containing protein [Tanacetum coccineum]
MSTLATAEEKTKKKNDVKARGLLLMVLPNKHQLTFSQYLDAKFMFAAIKTRFGGNAATKKTQKTLLKQQYENFSATSAESLDSIFNRLQKIVSRLAILGVIIAQEDLNLNFLSSLPTEWNTHVVVWMNKPEIETMSIDDLYNNFKIVEQKIKKTVGTSSGGQNLAFMSAPNSSSTNDASSQVSAASPSINISSPQDLEQIHEDDLEAMDLKWQLSLLSVRAKKYYQKTSKKIFINGNDIAGTKKQGTNEDTSKAMLTIDGVGFDWSNMAEEQVQTNIALMALSDLEVYTDKTCSKNCLKNYESLKKQHDDLLAKNLDTEFRTITYKRGLDIAEAQLVTYRKNEVLFSEEVVVLKREVGIKQYEINTLKTEFEKLKQEKDAIDFKIEKFDKALKDLDQLLRSQITDKSKKGFRYSAVSPPHPLIYNRPNKLDLSYSGLEEFKQPEFRGYGHENNKKESNVVCEIDSSKENSNKSLVEEQVTQVKSSSVEGCMSNTSKSVNEEEPKKDRKNNDAPIIEDWVSDDEEEDEPNPKSEKKTVIPTAAKKEFVKPVKPVKRSVRLRVVNTARSYRTSVNTVRPRVVNTTRQNRTFVNAARAIRYNAAKSSAYWVWRLTKSNGATLAFKRQTTLMHGADPRFVDSGCSRHMTGNIANLFDFKQFDGGYVAFGGDAYGGKITGKGTLKTDKLDFEDVYFVNELKFNLILLKIPRKDNMYNFDMKNIILKESLTCFIAKATLDESMLWHRRLGHINFKNIKRVNTFVAIGSKVQESKEKKEEGREEIATSSRKKMLRRKRVGKEQKKESSKKQKVEEEKESEEVDEINEVEFKKLMVIKKDEDIAIEAIPLATKLLVIVNYKLYKEGMLVHYELIRADGSSKRYSSMIRMLQGIDREDLEALWRIVKAKHGDTRPEDEFERVLYRDLKVMFEPDRISEVWIKL